MNQDNVKYSNTCISDLCIEGNVNVIKDYMDRYIYHINDYDLQIGINNAYINGNMEIIKLLTNKMTYINLHNEFRGAYLGGHINIIEYVISRVSSPMEIPWSSGFQGACEGGHINIVQALIDKGINSYGSGLVYACKGGHIDIVKLMISKGANNFNDGLSFACEGGHKNIVLLMIEKGANYFSAGLMNSCKSENLDLIKIMYELAYPNFNIYTNFDNVWTVGYPDIIEYFISKGYGPKKTYNFPYKNKKTKFYHNDMYHLKIKKDFMCHSILYWTIVYNEYHGHSRKLLENDLIPILLKLIYF